MERAKQGSCLNLHEYANVSFWNHDRAISKVDVVKCAQEVTMFGDVKKRDTSQEAPASSAERTAEQMLQKNIPPVVIQTPDAKLRPASAMEQRKYAAHLSCKGSPPKRVIGSLPCGMLDLETGSDISVTPPRRCRSALGARMYSAEKATMAAAQASPSRWRQDRALKAAGGVEDKPNSHKYEHGPWGVGDPRNKEVTVFTIPTTGMPPKCSWNPNPKIYHPPDFVTNNTFTPPPSPVLIKQQRNDAKSARASRRLTVHHNKKLLEQQRRERQLAITMARGGKGGEDAIRRVSQKLWLRMTCLQQRAGCWEARLKEKSGAVQDSKAPTCCNIHYTVLYMAGVHQTTSCQEEEARERGGINAS